jgi:hypothetical protein
VANGVQIIISARDLASQTFRNLDQNVNQSIRNLQNFGNTLSMTGQTMTFALSLPLAAVGVAAGKMAIDAVESENLFEVSMGNMADSARKWSEELQTSLGLNEFEVRKNVGTFNVMLDSMGMAEQAAFDMSKGLTQIGYDMASFYNLKPEEAFLKLQSGISGEIEPLKRLGIIVNENMINNWALTHGIIKQGEELSEAGKVWARYNVIMDATQKAQGDLARTLDSPANQLRITMEKLKTAGISLGNALIPPLLAVLKPITNLLDWFNRLPPSIKEVTVWFGIFAASIGPVCAVVGGLIAVLSGPIGLTIAIGAVIAGLIGWGRYQDDLKGKIEQQTAISDSAQNKAKQLADKYGDQANRLNELIPQYDKLSSKTKKTKEEKDQLRQVIDEIVEIAPQAVTGYDNMGKALIGNAKAAREASDEMWKLREEQLKIAAEHAKYELPLVQERIKDYQAKFNRDKKNIDKKEIKVDQLQGLSNLMNNAKLSAEIKQKAWADGIKKGLIDGMAPLESVLAQAKLERDKVFEKFAENSEGLQTAILRANELNSNMKEYETSLKLKRGEKPPVQTPPVTKPTDTTDFIKTKNTTDKTTKSVFDLKAALGEIDKAFGDARIIAERFGDTTGLAGKQADILRSGIENLIKNGIKPESAEVQKLFKLYQEMSTKQIKEDALFGSINSALTAGLDASQIGIKIKEVNDAVAAERKKQIADLIKNTKQDLSQAKILDGILPDFDLFESQISTLKQSIESLALKDPKNKGLSKWIEELKRLEEEQKKTALSSDLLNSAQEELDTYYNQNISSIDQMINKLKEQAAVDAKNTEELLKKAEALKKVKTEQEKVTKEEQKKDFINDLKSKALNAAPMVANVVQGAQQGAAAGPWGAVVGGLMPLIMESQTFKDLLAGINPILQGLADCIGRLLEPLIPLVVVIGQVLSPVFKVLGVILSSVFMPTLKALFPIIKFFGLAVIKVAQLISGVWNAIANAVNAALGWLNVHINTIDTGDLQKSFDELKNTTWENAMAQGKAADKAKEVAEALSNVPDGFKIQKYRFEAAQAVGLPSGGVNSTKTITIKQLIINDKWSFEEFKRLAELDNVRYNGSTIGGNAYAGSW